MSKNGTHKLSNLKTLCADCHNAIHGRGMAPTGESSNDSRSLFSWSQWNGPPKIEACPDCGGRMSLSRSDSVINGNDGYEFNCRDCDVELHAITPKRLIVVDGLSNKLHRESLDVSQVNRLGRASRNDNRYDERLREIHSEIRRRNRKINGISILGCLIAGVAFYFAYFHQNFASGIIGLLTAFVFLVFLKSRHTFDIT